MKSEGQLIEELKRSYCTFCKNTDIEIIRTIRIRCKKCGKTRLMQQHIKTESMK